MTKQICPECKTGMLDYMLDTKSTECSHIGCLHDGSCGMFVPLKEKEIRGDAIGFNKINC